MKKSIGITPNIETLFGTRDRARSGARARPRARVRWLDHRLGESRGWGALSDSPTDRRERAAVRRLRTARGSKTMVQPLESVFIRVSAALEPCAALRHKGNDSAL